MKRNNHFKTRGRKRAYFTEIVNHDTSEDTPLHIVILTVISILSGFVLIYIHINQWLIVNMHPQ